MRRTPKLLSLAAVAAVVASSSAALASADRESISRGRMPVVPASAGHLVNHEPEVFWSKDHKADAEAATPAAPGNNLVYGGGTGSGNISTTPGVYLVFYGSQWSKTDPLAAYLTSFFKGLYGPGDDWTTVADEFCEGVSAGAVSCPAGVPHVGGPTGPLVKGVWFDDATPAIPVDEPVVQVGTGKIGDQIAAEAVRAAAHFGNTTQAGNNNAQYIVATPSHFNSALYGAYYCAYHSAVTSNYGTVAYTNLPYVTDLGFACGQSSVNSGSAGTYDGVSIVAGHEYLEMITDMRPRTGWTDVNGEENADKCAWLSSGQGAMDNLHLSTGQFAVQSTWSNAFNSGDGGCVLHAG